MEVTKPVFQDDFTLSTYGHGLVTIGEDESAGLDKMTILRSAFESLALK